jgi:TatD DNase family protein
LIDPPVMPSDGPRLFDSHCHLDVAEFDSDRAAVVERARVAGVMRQLVPAIDAAGWPRLREVCAEFEGLHPAYGMHPIFLAAHQPRHLEDLREWIERERPLAIGECGLDFHLDGLDADTQQLYFRGQLAIAREYGLPLVVHARHAVEAVIAAIKATGDVRGVVHSFAGSIEQARQLHDLGFLVGLGGPVTYERAKRLRRVAVALPIEQLLLETDAPDQPDAQHRGQRNEPARIVDVLQVIAGLRGEDPAAIAAATTRNAERLFGLPPA